MTTSWNPDDRLKEQISERLMSDCDHCKKHWDLMLDHIKENTKLRAEVEALKADAERYQWLRDQKLDDPEIFIGVDSQDFPNRWALGHEEAKKIDAAIDAARSK